MKPVRIILALLCVTTSIVTASCTGDLPNIRDTRAPVFLVAETEQKFIEVDVSRDRDCEQTNTSIAVRFFNRVKVDNEEFPIDSTSGLHDIIVDSYRVSFVRTDGGTSVPSPTENRISALVNVDSSTSATVVVVPVTVKAAPPFSYLVSPAFCDGLGYEPDTGLRGISVTCFLEFFGRTVAGEKVSASAQTTMFVMDVKE